MNEFDDDYIEPSFVPGISESSNQTPSPNQSHAIESVQPQRLTRSQLVDQLYQTTEQLTFEIESSRFDLEEAQNDLEDARILQQQHRLNQRAAIQKRGLDAQLRGKRRQVDSIYDQLQP